MGPRGSRAQPPARLPHLCPGQRAQQAAHAGDEPHAHEAVTAAGQQQHGLLLLPFA